MAMLSGDDWKSNLALIVGGAILLSLLAYVCTHSCPAGSTWDFNKSCCVDAFGNCITKCFPDVLDAACDAKCPCHPVGNPCSCGCGNLVCEPGIGEDCNTCPGDCGVCPPPVVITPCTHNGMPCVASGECCSSNCNPPGSVCCPGGTQWSGALSCCADLISGICNCYGNGVICGAPAECCTGNCDNSHCCPVGTIWNATENCCQNPAGVCVCYGKGSSCAGDPDCCGALYCSNLHCCQGSDYWNAGLSCCADLTTNLCSCLGRSQLCTMPDECCSGNCDSGHCCPTGTVWDSVDSCCKNAAGSCVGMGDWDWYCLGGDVNLSALPPPTCGSGACDPGETCASCPGDCGICPTCNGNGVCDVGENCLNCPGDCSVTVPPAPDFSQTVSEQYATSAGNNSAYSFIITVPVGTINTATMDIRYDDCGSTSINGVPAHGAYPCGTNAVWVYGIDITPNVHTGVNVFNLMVHDTIGGFIGYDAIITVTYSPNTECCGDGACTGTETCVTCTGDCGSCCNGDGLCTGGETCLTCPADCANTYTPSPVTKSLVVVSAPSTQWDTGTFLENVTIPPYPMSTAQFTSIWYDDCGTVEINDLLAHQEPDCSGSATPTYTNIDVRPYTFPAWNILRFDVQDTRTGGAIGYNVDFEATFAPVSTCCGDGICEGPETCTNCPADCTAPPIDISQTLAFSEASAMGTIRTYTEVLTLSNNRISTATMDVWYDDCGQTKLNGFIVHDNFPCSTLATPKQFGIDMVPFLVPGNNVFEFWTNDSHGGGNIGYDVDVVVNYAPCT
ncbi:MAG: hypothetical protein ABIG39_04030 [Candidatus Micrarchaeota archaeon]